MYRTCRIHSLEADDDRSGDIVVKVSTNAFDSEEHWEQLYCHGDDEHYKVVLKAEIKKKEVSPAVQCLCTTFLICFRLCMLLHVPGRSAVVLRA